MLLSRCYDTSAQPAVTVVETGGTLVQLAIDTGPTKFSRWKALKWMQRREESRVMRIWVVDVAHGVSMPASSLSLLSSLVQWMKKGVGILNSHREVRKRTEIPL